MIIATAGHVDHGKTSLVRALTGIETDSLEEERRRGLSINLGYAYKPLADNAVLGFIDVPGHSRFINTMISGVSGIDLGMLVVAADDGLMPQTVEHLQVLEVLGVREYMLVVSKIDLVEPKRVAQVETALLQHLPAGTPSFAVSSISEEGIDSLLSALEARARVERSRDTTEHFRLSVDRAFQVKGAGLVVTGTVASGVVQVGDTLHLQPQDTPVRVREIHAQNSQADSGCAGQRCAINISGAVHRDDIERGDWLAAIGSPAPSTRFDVRLQISAAALFGIKHMSQVKLHLGAKRFEAKIALLQTARKLAPGEECLAQVMTERPVLCSHGDRFLLRDFGETATLGGGIVLDPAGAEQERNTADRRQYLETLTAATMADVVQRYIVMADNTLNMDKLLQCWNSTRALDDLPRPAGVVSVMTEAGECWLSEARWQAGCETVHSTLLALQHENSSDQGIKPALLAQRCASLVDEALFASALKAMIRESKLVLREGLLSDTHFKSTVAQELSEDWLRLRGCLQRADKKIPSLSQLQQDESFDASQLKDTVYRAVKQKMLVKVNKKRVALPETLAEFAAMLLSLEAAGEELSVINVRDNSGCGRNLVVEILEYFDSVRFTRRSGDHRVIIDKDFPQRL